MSAIASLPEHHQPLGRLSKEPRLAKRVAIITGASQGFGQAIAIRFVEEGCKVVLVSRRGCDATMKILSTIEGVANVDDIALDVKCDIGKEDMIKILYAKVEEKFGPALHVLVNNAGITRDTLLMRMSEQQWDEVMNTNLKSAFNLTKAVQRTMLKARSGSIINMSSVVGIKGNAGQANYAASKAGLIGFTKSVAQELGSRNIRCNAIAPGFIETEMTEALDQKVVQEWRNGIPLKRGGAPIDVANATVFLASDMSAYVTGQTIHVCGGMLM